MNALCWKFFRTRVRPRLHHFTPLFAVGPFPLPGRQQKASVENASVYDRCTITPAEWHFPALDAILRICNLQVLNTVEKYDSKPLPATAGSHLALSSCPSEELPENFPLLISPRRVRFITHRNSEGLKLLSCRPNKLQELAFLPSLVVENTSRRQGNPIASAETFHSSHSVKSRSKGVNRPPTALAQRIFLTNTRFLQN